MGIYGALQRSARRVLPQLPAAWVTTIYGCMDGDRLDPAVMGAAPSPSCPCGVASETVGRPDCRGKLASIGAGLIMLCASRASAADEPQKWTGPFGGTFTVMLAFVSDYSFGGISQTSGNPPSSRA